MTQCQWQNVRLGTMVISVPTLLPLNKADSVKVYFPNYATLGHDILFQVTLTHCFI